MSLKDIILVGVPDAFVWLSFGILLCNSSYFKNKKPAIIFTKYVISMIFILSIVVYLRTIVSNIVYTSILSALLYAITFKYIWGFNIRLSVFTGFLFTFLSSSIENLFTPLFVYLSSFSNILTQSRFLLSLPIRLVEIILIFIVYKGKYEMRDMPLFKHDWNKMKLSKKISAIMLIVFVITGFIISISYTDVLIKHSTSVIDITSIAVDVNLMFYGVILLIITGLIIISRTRNYEVVKQEVFDIKNAFNLPKEKMFINFLQASQPEDIKKYMAILEKYTNEEVN